LRCTVVAILIFLVLAAGCKGGASRLKERDATEVSYKEAMRQLYKKDYVEAAELFETISSSTLNPILGQLSTLRLADSLFLQGSFAEAAEVYRQYEEQFAGTPDVDHATYMRGLSHLREMPDDTLLRPPAESREMSSVDSAYETLTALIDRNPTSYHAMRARLLVMQTVHRKCRHHLYVAAFYKRSRRPLGVVQRVEQALAYEQEEREKGYVPADFVCASDKDHLLMLADAYDKIGSLDGLAHTLERYRSGQAAFKAPQAGARKIEEAIARLEKAKSPKPK
jgi:outer membrane assembly lipoprotein YfiO